MTVKSNYMNPATAQLEGQLSRYAPKNAFTHWNGLIYSGGIKSFDTSESECVAKMPSFNADGSIKDDGEIYSASLAGQARRYAAGVTDTTDISGIATVTVLEEVLSKNWRQYNMEKVVRKVPMPNLAMKIDYISTKLAASQKVPELVEADIVDSAYTRVSFDLWKNVVHIAKSDKSQKQASQPIMDIDIEQASRGLAAARNAQIVTVFEASDSGTAGSDWGVETTTGQSDNNPQTDIQSAVNTIRTSGFNPNIIALEDQVWQEYQSNSYTQDTAQKWNQKAGTTEVALPGFPTLQVVVDTGMTSTIAVIADTQEWGVLGEGPKEIARYRNEIAGYDAFIIRDWLEVKEINDSAIVKLTGVTA